MIQMSRQSLGSAANVSSWSGGIAFFLSVAFRQSFHSEVVGRTPNLPVEKRAFYHLTTAAPGYIF